MPLTDEDVRRISERTGDPPREIVRFIDRHAIDMDDEPEAFAILRQGRRIMILRHQNGGCRYLGEDARCSIYGARPLGCRIFPFDPSFDKQGALRRLKLIQATDCPHELDGDNDAQALRALHTRYQAATRHYQEKIAAWNRQQKQRRRAGKLAQSGAKFLQFLGLSSA